jgi:hypothetical protein
MEVASTTSPLRLMSTLPMRALNNTRVRPVGCLTCLILAAATSLISGCISTSPSVVKIGFVAPFEGRYREIGDEVIPAARLAVRQFVQQFPNSKVVVELVAYDDQGDPALATEQARKLVADPAVVIVVGHWRDETTLAALPVYKQAGIPLVAYDSVELPSDGTTYNLSPSANDFRELAETWSRGHDAPSRVIQSLSDDLFAQVDAVRSAVDGPPDGKMIGGPDWGSHQFRILVGATLHQLYFVTGAPFPADLSAEGWTPSQINIFTDGFEEGSLGAPPGMLSVRAYEATWFAIRKVTNLTTTTPGSIPAPNFEFDAAGRLYDAPVYLYDWQNGQPQLAEKLR